MHLPMSLYHQKMDRYSAYDSEHGMHIINHDVNPITLPPFKARLQYNPQDKAPVPVSRGRHCREVIAFQSSDQFN